MQERHPHYYRPSVPAVQPNERHEEARGAKRQTQTCAIELEDLQRLKESAVITSIQCLVSWQPVFQFCRRGQEEQRNLTKSSFLFLKDETSEWYATRNHGPWRDKQNTPRGYTATDYEKLGRMYQRAESLRATAITLWSDAGLSTLSGHRNEFPFAAAPGVQQRSLICPKSTSQTSWSENASLPLEPAATSTILDPLLQTSKTSQSKVSDSSSQPSSRAAKSGKFTLFSRAIKHSGIHLEVLFLENRNSLNISSVFTELYAFLPKI